MVLSSYKEISSAIHHLEACLELLKGAIAGEDYFVTPDSKEA